MKIFLDNERTQPEGWKLVKTPKEMIDLLEMYEVAEISLDHDLGNDEGIETGYDVLKWIELQAYTNTRFHPPIIHIHNVNPSAKQKMELTKKSIERARK